MPGACSLASHIALKEVGIAFDIEKVDTQNRKTETGADFAAVNPKNKVPVLALDEGEVLTEGPAILQHIADSFPDANLTASPGMLARVRVNEHLTYVSSELHPAFGPLFTPSATEEQKQAAREAVAKKLDYINSVLSDGREYLVENRFTIADAYLFVVTNWTSFNDITLDKWAHLAEYMKRVASRTTVQAALKTEGLLG